MNAPELNLITVVGARPQFIKAAAVSRVLAATLGTDQPIHERILHTGQHYDAVMSDRFFEELGIPYPTWNLGVGGGSHGANTGRMLEAIEKVLLAERPGAVLVYGDTDSTLAGALAASKLRIPVLHVEAGLRSFNRHQPEEQNRVLTDHLAELCFAPTETAVSHLQREGIPAERIMRTGDVMADAARIFGAQAEDTATVLESLGLAQQAFVLATIHRAENTDNPQRLSTILNALATLASQGTGDYGPLPVLLPLHPRTRAHIQEQRLEPLLEALTLTSPLGFLEMVLLERRAAMIVTDSGGVQKEAFLQGTPCVTVRSETEWVELTDSGWNHLVDPIHPDAVLQAMARQLGFDRSLPRPLLYGNGHAAAEIVLRIQTHFR